MPELSIPVPPPAPARQAGPAPAEGRPGVGHPSVWRRMADALMASHRAGVPF